MVRIQMFVALTVAALSSAPALADDIHGYVVYPADPAGNEQQAGSYTLDGRGLVIHHTDGYHGWFVPREEFQRKLGNVQGDLLDLMNAMQRESFAFTFYNPNTNKVLGGGSLRFTVDSQANKVYISFTYDNSPEEALASVLVLKVDP